MTYTQAIRYADRQGCSRSAGLENIRYYLKQARGAVKEAQREVVWLETLEAERQGQIDRGEWP